MRSPFFVAAFSGFAIIAGCSQPEARADDELRRDLDLALNGGGRAVVSNLEIAGAQKTPMHAPAAPAHEHAAQAHKPRRVPAVAEPVQVAASVHPEEVSGTQPARGAPAEETTTIVTDPAPQPAGTRNEPEPAPSGRGRLGGNYPMPTDIGIERPGNGGGIIIIRGGPGADDDKCDERDRHGRGGRNLPGIGGVLINPTFPSPSGGRTGTGGRGGGIFR